MAPLRSKRVEIEDLLFLHNAGIIGRVEFRDWLAREYPTFKEVRSSEVDDFFKKVGTQLLDNIDSEREVEDE